MDHDVSAGGYFQPLGLRVSSSGPWRLKVCQMVGSLLPFMSFVIKSVIFASDGAQELT